MSIITTQMTRKSGLSHFFNQLIILSQQTQYGIEKANKNGKEEGMQVILHVVTQTDSTFLAK